MGITGVEDRKYIAVRENAFLGNADEKALIDIAAGRGEGTIDEQIATARAILANSKNVDVNKHVGFSDGISSNLAVFLITGARAGNGKGLEYRLAIEVIPYCSIELLEGFYRHLTDYFRPNYKNMGGCSFGSHMVAVSGTKLHEDIYQELYDAYMNKFYANEPLAYLDAMSMFPDYEPKWKTVLDNTESKSRSNQLK